jgi:hypothetical protein
MKNIFKTWGKNRTLNDIGTVNIGIFNFKYILLQNFAHRFFKSNIHYQQ